jgi:hypothetical protein
MAEVGKQISILKVEMGGKIVILSDSSRWRVRIGDHTKSICWYATQRIVIEEGNTPSYPYRLRNLDTAQDVVDVAPI